MSKQIDTDTLRAWLDEQRPVMVLDIRNDEARAQWAIPGSLHVNAYEELREGRPGQLATTDLPRDRPVVTVCGAGRVSQTAADLLVARGLDARSLTGGMKAWSWRGTKRTCRRHTQARASSRFAAPARAACPTSSDRRARRSSSTRRCRVTITMRLPVSAAIRDRDVMAALSLKASIS